MKSIKRLILGTQGILFVLLFGPASFGRAQTYTWSTIAGISGASGTNDGVGFAALFDGPFGITVDGSGSNIYVADYGNDTIRKLTFNSATSNWWVTTVAGKAGVASDFDGNGTEASFNSPAGIVAVGPTTLYVSDAPAGSFGSVRQLKFIGGIWQVTNLSLTGGNFGSLFTQPTSLAIDGFGDLLLPLTGKNLIDEVTFQPPKWTATTILGSGVSGHADGTNLLATFAAPNGIACDPAGDIYLADSGNHIIRKLVAGSGTNWITTTVAGLAGSHGNADGTNTSALFYGPDGIAADQSGNLYVSDGNNNAIRKLTLQGTNWSVSTIGGSLTGNFGTNDGVGRVASFYHPVGIAVDGLGRIFVADSQNHTIRIGVPSAQTNPPPPLQLATGGGAAFIMWPVSSVGCFLQTTTNFDSGPWTTVTNGVTTNFVFSGPMTNAQRFYRLQPE